MIRIALIHPDIPQNVGNIARLCVGLNAELHLVHPIGFVLDDKKVKRAGLDYWQDLKLMEHDSHETFLEAHKQDRMFFLTTKAKKLYTEIKFNDGDFLVFGSESKGLPEFLLKSQWQNAVTIPMSGPVRSLNVSNAVALVAYEMYRQIKLSYS